MPWLFSFFFTRVNTMRRADSSAMWLAKSTCAKYYMTSYAYRTGVGVTLRALSYDKHQPPL